MYEAKRAFVNKARLVPGPVTPDALFIAGEAVRAARRSGPLP